MATKKKAKRLVRGKDWHGWCYKFGPAAGPAFEGKLCLFAEYDPGDRIHSNRRAKFAGEWVRVKFVEVK